MGKTSRWFRRLFSAKKSIDSLPDANGSDSNSLKEKKKWSSTKSHNSTDSTAAANKGERFSSPHFVGAIDANKHAIAVAAATAAVAEAAVAAAKAAAEVVRLTSGGRRNYPTVSRSGRYMEVLAAIKIQSAFRGYLARRALKALKGLVKLQALVRGHIVRKQTADMLRRMQALVRAQARARSSRAHMSESASLSSKSSLSHHSRCGSNSNIKNNVLDKAHLDSNWLDRWMEECLWNDRSVKTYADDEKSAKILEVDTWKPNLNSNNFKTSHHVSTFDYTNRSYTTHDSSSKYTKKSHKSVPSLSSGDVSSLRSPKFPMGVDQTVLWNAENSPRVFSALSRPGSSVGRGSFTPRSECSRSVFSGYADYPNYMANTESYRAKVRSQSAPRQRVEFEKYSSTRGSVLKDSAILADLRNKAYPVAGYYETASLR